MRLGLYITIFIFLECLSTIFPLAQLCTCTWYYTTSVSWLVSNGGLRVFIQRCFAALESVQTVTSRVCARSLPTLQTRASSLGFYPAS
ncbi:hypothetical protein F5Y01DRAFT_233504 [Xylaria sp. FL0043]|nr:hypothetical protein F5Y01DRAFT_233504 [Xylaria sp. FL0043]